MFKFIYMCKDRGTQLVKRKYFDTDSDFILLDCSELPCETVLKTNFAECNYCFPTASIDLRTTEMQQNAAKI